MNSPRALNGQNRNVKLLRRARSFIGEMLESRLLMSSVVVNTTVDSLFAPSSGMVSLRNAVATANASTTATTITFSPTVFATSKTIVLNGTDLAFTNTGQATSIVGPAAGLTISGNAKSQGLNISGATVTITGVTISDCTAPLGAAIETSGNLTLKNSTLSLNDATSNDDGGGIAIDGGKTTLINDTIANNTGDGLNPRGGTVLVEDCTITGNTSYGGYPGAGIYVQGGSAVTVSNSVIAGNKLTTPGGSEDVFGPFISLGYNLVGETDGSTGFKSTDLTGTVAHPLSAKLGALANNGGPTQTVLPLAGSPLLGAGHVASIPSGVTTDQRGQPRVVSGKVDIGAVEVQPTTPSIKVTPPANQSTSQFLSPTVQLGSFTQVLTTAPYKVDVNWGDGSADTVFSVSAAGAIPAQVHTFSKAGAFPVTEVVTDSKGVTSNKGTFTETVAAATTGIITGEVFKDLNGNGKLDGSDAALSGWIVYVDANGNGQFDPTEQYVLTDSKGNYSLTLKAGTYMIAVQIRQGFYQSAPHTLSYKVAVTAGKTTPGDIFGVTPIVPA